MSKEIRVLDFINTDRSARELLAHRVAQIDNTEGYINFICCGPGPYVKVLREEGHQVLVVNQPRGMNIKEIVKAIFRFRRILQKNHIEILHTHGSLVGMIGRIAALLAGTPFVVHQIHGFHHHQNMSRSARWFSKTSEKIAALWTNALLFQNASDLSLCAETGIAPTEKLHLIRNGVNLQNFHNQPPQHNEIPIIICVARFERVKNHTMLLRAAKILFDEGVDFRLELVGDGPLRAEYIEWVSKNNLESKVKFLGYREDTPSLTAAADICVLVSLKEGIPRAIMEASAAGKPIVATNVIGNRDAVRDGETGFLVELGDSPQLAQFLLLLLKNGDRRLKMGKLGRQKAIEHFDEIKVANRILTVYDNLMCGNIK